jgi:uncharacterized membrane protein
MAHPYLGPIVILLSLVGLGDAIYFTLAFYGRVENARWVPEILCAREGSSCVTVVKTQYARVFGWPNSLFGIAYYLALIGWTLIPADWLLALSLNAAPVSFFFRFLLTAASTVTVVLGSYLVYALREKLHTHCPLCYLAHGINAALFVLVILTVW